MATRLIIEVGSLGLGPHLPVLLFHAADAAPAHLFVAADIGLGEMAVLAQEDSRAQPEYRQADEQNGGKEDFHGILEDEFRTDGVVMVHFVNDPGEGGGHRDDLDLAGGFRTGTQRDGVGHEDFLERRTVDAFDGLP